MKDRKCKCSHLKSEHHKVWLTHHSYCKECHCENYLRFDAPTKFDLFGVFYAFIIFGYMIYGFTSLYIIFISADQETLNTPYLTLGEFGEIMIPLFGGLAALGCLFVYDMFINDYFKRKNRRNFN